MYRKLTALALFSAAACLGAANAQAAQLADVTGWFVNGGVGSAHYKAMYAGVSGKESDNAFQFNAGWRSQFIGLEAGYVDLGQVSANDDMGSSAKLSGKGWTAGLNGHFNPVGKWYISARAGFFGWTLDARADLSDGAGGSTHLSGSTHSVNGYAGLGTGIDFNRHWSLGVNFDYYQIKKSGFDIDTRTYSLIAEYRF